MSVVKSVLRTAAGIAVLLACVSSARAQATRTWVSGVGDDVNPCSRTAPCKTFAGAISKTAAKGEINVLDPGGFGGVTITKAITISSEGIEAGVLVSGTNGITINAGATDSVVLRGLDIEGVGTGLSGINFLGGGSLTVEKCTINDFTVAGINFVPSNASQLIVTDTNIRNNPIGAPPNGGAILIKPNGGAALAAIDNVRMSNCLYGLRVETNSKVTANRCIAAGNSANGFLCAVGVGQTAELNLESCVATNTTTNGIATAGAGSTIRISNCTVTNNNTGLNHAASGQILSYSNNKVSGNAPGGDGTVTGTIGPM